MRSIVSERWKTYGPAIDHHVGDIAWSLRNPSDDARLVVIDDRAYAFLNEDPFCFGARPGSEDVYGELIDACGDDAVFWALDCETEKVAALASRGYFADGAGDTWYLVCDLSELTDVALPEGWSVADATDPAVWPERVRVHQAAWGSSKFTGEVYTHTRANWPYRADLDVGVVGPDDRWAAYTIAWFDENARIGELEPVGTVPEFRRRGLGAAACLSALHRLRDAGATSCIVVAVTDPNNQGPRKLYESIGFKVAARVQTFRRANK